MIKIAIAGDVHGRFDLLFEKAKALGVDVLLQLGDTGIFPDPSKADPASRRHGIPLDFQPYLTGEKGVPLSTAVIQGNHEDFDFLEDVLRNHNGFIAPHLWYIPNGSVLTVGGTRFGVLGGNYSSTFFSEKQPVGGKRKHFTQRQMETLRETGFDVLLLHDGPKSEKLPKGAAVLTDFIEETQPSRVYHGHFHWPYRTTIGKTEIIGLGHIAYGGESIVLY